MKVLRAQSSHVVCLYKHRMLSARMKAEQAEEVAKRASSDAEAARIKAREYSPGTSQPGKSISLRLPAVICMSMRSLILTHGVPVAKSWR